MAPILDPKFCSRCGAPMARAVPPTDSRERHVCTKCGWIHYLDPKVACG
ncbi:MAG TPA: zinc ribbon domain-containing protein, partial [Planctomycetota bacterium]|nr:zinc ribbon domain-containing protein [Planctomycetota bacterium]